MRLRIYFCLLSLIALSPSVTATEMTHRFDNPSFGGNPSNGTVLMSQATNQNMLKDPRVAAQAATQQTAFDRFKSNLQSAILSQVSRTSVQNLFDSNGNLKLGSVLNFDPYGDGTSTFSVQVSDSAVNGNVDISITDGITSTVLTVPYLPVTTQK